MFRGNPNIQVKESRLPGCERVIVPLTVDDVKTGMNHVYERFQRDREFKKSKDGQAPLDDWTFFLEFDYVQNSKRITYLRVQDSRVVAKNGRAQMVYGSLNRELPIVRRVTGLEDIWEDPEAGFEREDLARKLYDYQRTHQGDAADTVRRIMNKQSVSRVATSATIRFTDGSTLEIEIPVTDKIEFYQKRLDKLDAQAANIPLEGKE